MRYLEINTGQPTDPVELPWWVKLLQWIVPAANPDLEQYFDKTQVWWLEINDNGEPLREIGFDVNGDAIVLGPVEDNFGLLMDASDDWSESSKDSLEAAENFDQVWTSLWPKFDKLDQRSCLKHKQTTSPDK